MAELTHLDEQGSARMVDVGAKAETARVAVARGEIRLESATISLLRDGTAPKGDVLAAARIAGIMAAKRTSELIPLCHPIALDKATVRLDLTDDRVLIESEVRCSGRTGVEMEALTAVSVAALTVYDMVKAVDRSAVIGEIRLVSKSGGKSGEFRREE